VSSLDSNEAPSSVLSAIRFLYLPMSVDTTGCPKVGFSETTVKHAENSVFRALQPSGLVQPEPDNSRVGDHPGLTERSPQRPLSGETSGS
jgi:hypothetical protein